MWGHPCCASRACWVSRAYRISRSCWASRGYRSSHACWASCACRASLLANLVVLAELLILKRNLTNGNYAMLFLSAGKGHECIKFCIHPENKIYKKNISKIFNYSINYIIICAGLASNLMLLTQYTPIIIDTLFSWGDLKKKNKHLWIKVYWFYIKISYNSGSKNLQFMLFKAVRVWILCNYLTTN